MVFINSILLDHSFKSLQVTQFLADSWSLLSSNQSIPQSSVYFQIYIDKFLQQQSKETLDSELVRKFHFNRASFRKLIENSKNYSFQLVRDVLLRHQQAFLFENEDLNLLEHLNALNVKHAESIDLVGKCLKFVLEHLTANSEQISVFKPLNCIYFEYIIAKYSKRVLK